MKQPTAMPAVKLPINVSVLTRKFYSHKHFSQQYVQLFKSGDSLHTIILTALSWTRRRQTLLLRSKFPPSSALPLPDLLRDALCIYIRLMRILAASAIQPHLSGCLPNSDLVASRSGLHSVWEKAARSRLARTWTNSTSARGTSPSSKPQMETDEGPGCQATGQWQMESVR